MYLEETSLEDFYIIKPKLHVDNRGYFLKNFYKSFFLNSGLEYNFTESYFSSSKKGIIRGLHFQFPPFDHVKLVSLLSGRAFDVVVDIRKNSSTYGSWEIVDLNLTTPKILYIPKGFAHGFCSLEDRTILQYMTTTEYKEENDSGIKWDSIDIPWPTQDPIISDRDENFITFKDFESPFIK